MSKIFASYAYTAKSGGQIYSGYGNILYDDLERSAVDEEYIHMIEEKCRKHCISFNGFDTATATLITCDRLTFK